jgi:hypothetical protein
MAGGRRRRLLLVVVVLLALVAAAYTAMVGDTLAVLSSMQASLPRPVLQRLGGTDRHAEGTVSDRMTTSAAVPRRNADDSGGDEAWWTRPAEGDAANATARRPSSKLLGAPGALARCAAVTLEGADAGGTIPCFVPAATVAPAACPTVRRAVAGVGKTIELSAAEARLRLAAKAKNYTVLRGLVRGACAWTAGTVVAQWEKGALNGAAVRTLFRMPDLFDCTPNVSALPRATVVPRRTGGRHREDAYAARRPYDKNFAVVPVADGDVAAVPRRSRTTVEHRNKTRSWTHFEHVCMSCEAEANFFMLTPRRCHTTLWSLNMGLKRRYMRHHIFRDRHGGFQTFGEVKPSDKRLRDQANLDFVNGTTFYVAAYPGDNVGHQLHDAAWSVHATLLMAQRGEFPAPHRAMLDDDFAARSMPYFTYLASASIGAMLRPNATAGGGGGGGAQAWQNPLSARKQKVGTRLLCFENLVVPGVDRTGHGGGTPASTRTMVAHSFRAAVFDNLDVPRDVRTGRGRPPQVYVYGRHDVSRRSLDNIGALFAAAEEVTRSMGLPPPIVISTFNMSPQAQIVLFSRVDVMLGMQGAHLQHSLFMPRDGAVMEIAPCHSVLTSFVSRYGMFLPTQTFWQLRVCAPVINLTEQSRIGQNVTLCPRHLAAIQTQLRGTLLNQTRGRRAPAGDDGGEQPPNA